MIKEPKLWVFRAYESEVDYDAGKHIDEAVFYDFDAMKNYSAEHSRNWDRVFPGYVSMYWQYILND